MKNISQNNDSWVDSYRDLGSEFYSSTPPQPLKGLTLRHFNESLAAQLEIDVKHFVSDEFQLSLASQLKFRELAPISTVYSGHQFGVWAGQLGDGRAHLLGEWKTPNHWLDMQLKGSGLTRYSRRGDGRAVWRSSLREYLASEAMAVLGVPTSRALALWDSQERVYRETIEPGALLLRAGDCFVRFGTFEHFFSIERYDLLQQLLDYSINRWYPEINDHKTRVKSFVLTVAKKTAELMAQWQGIGFCHGVMNTDNMAINGDTIDYGPFGFVDHFNYNHICNHSDDQGRYKYGDQPGVGLWNVMRLHESLGPLMQGEDDLTVVDLKEEYIQHYRQCSNKIWSEKLGLFVDDNTLMEFMGKTFGFLHKSQIDWTDFWWRLSHLNAQAEISYKELGVNKQDAEVWFQEYKSLRHSESWSEGQKKMQTANPRFVLRNHLIQRLLKLSPDSEEYKAGFDKLYRALQNPFKEFEDYEDLYLPPSPDEMGFIPSCSS